jgi:hypothetical protein
VGLVVLAMAVAAASAVLVGLLVMPSLATEEVSSQSDSHVTYVLCYRQCMGLNCQNRPAGCLVLDLLCHCSR